MYLIPTNILLNYDNIIGCINDTNDYNKIYTILH